MFTGIIETTGKIVSVRKDASNLVFGVKTAIARELKIGQSVAHNGVCLTVSALEREEEEIYFVTAVKETLTKTNLGSVRKGSIINLERSLKIGDRLDGHFVQGHVDCTAEIKSIKKEKGSWLFKFAISPKSPKGLLRRNLKSGERNLIINKGSICINGVSLTIVKVFNSQLSGAALSDRTSYSPLEFSVAIIPHTFQHTNFSSLKKEDAVNIEFDILGKYILAQLNLNKQKIISYK